MFQAGCTWYIIKQRAEMQRFVFLELRTSIPICTHHHKPGICLGKVFSPKILKNHCLPNTCENRSNETLMEIASYCIIMHFIILLYHIRIAPIKAQRTSLKSCLSHVKLRCQLEVPGADGQVETLNWEVPEWWDDVRYLRVCNVQCKGGI